MELNYFYIAVSLVILLLGLKGIINGFFKELFGLVGIIAGIFIASRAGNEVGQYLSDIIFKFDNASAVNFTGFIVTLIVFWIFMIVLGLIFKKLSSMSGLGVVDRIFGFILGASKFFLIGAVIAHAAYNIKAVKSKVDESLGDSVIFPILVETGSYIMKIDPIDMGDSINDTIDDVTNKVSDSVNETITESAQDIVKNTKEQISSTQKEH